MAPTAGLQHKYSRIAPVSFTSARPTVGYELASAPGLHEALRAATSAVKKARACAIYSGIHPQSSVAERRPGRVLRKLLGNVTTPLVTNVNSISGRDLMPDMAMETRIVGTRMTPEPDLAAKPSYRAALVRFSGCREDKRGCGQHCHQSSHHLDAHLAAPSSFRMRLVVYSSNSSSMPAFHMHCPPCRD
jgi:hypothetical protein